MAEPGAGPGGTAAAPPSGVMARGGFYNDHAAPQGDAAGFGLAAWRAAAAAVPIDRTPFVIADYGAAQGRNSLRPMREAVAAVRERAGEALPIAVVHTDIPGNDFTALFALLDAGPPSYLADAANVFAYAAGRTFYRRLFPPGLVSLGWSAIAAHWLSAAPAAVPDHIWPPRAPEAVRAAFARRSAEDWATFLGHRAAELRPGGRLVVLAGAADAGGDGGADGLMDLADLALRDLVAEGVLAAAERGRMVVPTWNRRPEDFIAPFAAGAAGGLVLESHALHVLADAFWPAYEATGDADAYAATATDFFTAAFAPSLLAALDPGRGAAARAEIGAALGRALRERVRREPARASCRWRVFAMAIAKPA